MKNIYIINAHERYPFSEGRLNSTLVEKAKAMLIAKGLNVKTFAMKEELNVDEEIEKHVWADGLILQAPVNWMGVPWSFKKYMDYVYSAGMTGQLCEGDGRSREDSTKQYGSGGALKGKKYLLSLTFNAPKESFDDPEQYLFRGKSVDDLFLPMHINFRFFSMEPLPTFCCFDVLKNPDVENDLIRFEEHIKKYFLTKPE